jgi:hypothetical protein
MNLSGMIRATVVVFALPLLAGTARAQGNVGFGVILGDPSGLAWKYSFSRANAVAGEIGVSPFNRIRFDVDYLWQARPFAEQNLSVHYGPGLALGVRRQDVPFDGSGRYFLRSDDLGFGVRLAVGLTYMIPRSPVDIFVQLAPVIILATGAGFGVDAGIGARVYP